MKKLTHNILCVIFFLICMFGVHYELRSDDYGYTSLLAEYWGFIIPILIGAAFTLLVIRNPLNSD